MVLLKKARKWSARWILRTFSPLISLFVTMLFSGIANAGLIQSYYLASGDQQTVVEIQGTSVVNTFSSFSRGYPLAIRDTIWLGDLNDRNAIEYNLNGTPTGNSSLGGNNFSQLLDGTAGFGSNYGVECCGILDSVTVANPDWTGQTVLFNLGHEGFGVAFDPIDSTLWISDRGSNNTIYHYDLLGNLLTSFAPGGFLVGLAYESASDSLWAYNRASLGMVQFDRTGTILDSFAVGGLVNRNYFGGEIALAVPEPTTVLLMGIGLAGLGFARRRRLNG